MKSLRNWKAESINVLRQCLLVGWCCLLLGVALGSGCTKRHPHEPGPQGEIGPTGTTGPTGPTGPQGEAKNITVKHHVSIKHDSRSAPDSYRVKLNGTTLRDTTFIETGNGQLVPFVNFETVSGDVLSFETPGGGSNEAFVDSTVFVVN